MGTGNEHVWRTRRRQSMCRGLLQSDSLISRPEQSAVKKIYDSVGPQWTLIFTMTSCTSQLGGLSSIHGARPTPVSTSIMRAESESGVWNE